MKKVHLVVCDLFLPADIAAEVCAGLRLPALEKMLARGASTGSARTGVAGSASLAGSGLAGGGASLENFLCELFGVPCEPCAPIAPISAAYDGLGGGCDKLLAKPADCGSSRQAALPAPGGSASPCQGGGCDTLLAKPADCGSSRQATLPAPEGSASPCQGGACWLRADPVHLRLQHDKLILLPGVKVDAGEAGQLRAALNEHFAGQGIEFFAPHPQRWYMRLDRFPDIETAPLSQVLGRNVHGLLPMGKDAAHWHRVFNEIQMLLFGNPVNEAREARGDLPVNGLWLWGGGCAADTLPEKTYDYVSSDDVLAGMFASAAAIPFAEWPERWSAGEAGRQLLVWTSLRSALQQGDLGAWRNALQDFETGFAQPLWQALRTGKISQLQVDIQGGDRALRLALNRADAWAFWRRTKPLADYSIV